MSIAIKVPTMGESVTEATIARWLKKEGDAVKQDETIVELETDKVNVEVPSPAAGVLEHIEIPQGGTVNVGTVIGQVSEGAAAAQAPAKPAKAEAPNPLPKPPPQAKPRARKARAESSALLPFRLRRHRCGASRKKKSSTPPPSKARANAAK